MTSYFSIQKIPKAFVNSKTGSGAQTPYQPRPNPFLNSMSCPDFVLGAEQPCEHGHSLFFQKKPVFSSMRQAAYVFDFSAKQPYIRGPLMF
jgi:hypothetical protein